MLWCMQTTKPRSDPISVLDVVASLLDKSLLLQVKQEGDEPRLVMLETVREYGMECLRESGEAEVSQRAYALYYLRLAEQAEPHLKGAQQMVWLEQMEMEQENSASGASVALGAEGGGSRRTVRRSDGMVLVCPWLLERGAALAESSIGIATHGRKNGSESESTQRCRNVGLISIRLHGSRCLI